MRSLRSLCLGVVVVAVLAPHPAAAAGKKPVESPELAEGRRLMAAHDYAGACPKLAASESDSPSPGTAMMLAICYEKAGKIASAWKAYGEAESVAASSHKKGVAGAARRSAQRLEGEVSHLKIVLPSGHGAAIEVRRDGNVVPESEINAPVAVDGGPHDIEVSAASKKTWKTHVEVAATGQNATVDVPPLEDDAPAAAAAPQSAPAAAEAPPPSDGQGQRVAGVTLAVLGAVAAAAGTAAGLEANAKYHDALSACNGTTVCASGSDGPSLRSSAGTWATVSTAAFITGGVAIAGGAVLWFTAPRGPSATTVGLAPARLGEGLSLVGRF
jgi:hypothetical protein